MTPLSPGIRYIIASTFFFALMNIGVKYLKHIPASEIVFFRALTTLVVGYFLLRRRRLNPWGNNKKLLILRGLSGTIALVMYFFTLQKMPLASAVTIQYLSPIFTIIIAGILVKEPPRQVQWLFFLISFAGVIMIKGFDPRITPVELMIGISAAVFSALAYNFIRMLKNHDDPLVVVFYFPLVTVPIVGIYTAFDWTTPGLYDWPILIGIGLATTVAQIFMTRAYQLEKAANVSNYNYLGAIYAIAIGYFLFGETISPLGYAGMALIIIGVLLSSRFRKEPFPETRSSRGMERN
jgi:drug/metabolite transporter (DMT)-like permease